MSLENRSQYVIMLQSWFDKDAENVKYLKFGKNWKNGEWVGTVQEATLVDSQDLADRIAWYWGVTYKEIE